MGLHLIHPQEWLVPSTASRRNNSTARNIFTSQPRTANDHDQRKEKKKSPSKHFFITANIPICFEKRSIIETLPTAQRNPCLSLPPIHILIRPRPTPTAGPQSPTKPSMGPESCSWLRNPNSG